MGKWIYKGIRRNIRGRWVYDGDVWENDGRPSVQFEELKDTKKTKVLKKINKVVNE